MRLIPADQWQPAPGTIVEWGPTAATTAAVDDLIAQDASHAVGPSFLQRDHIAAVHTNRVAGRTHRAYTCAAAHVDGPLDITAMNAALTEFVRAHAGLRSTFRVGEDAEGRATDIVRFVVPASDIEIIGREGPESVCATGDVVTHLDDRLPTTAVFDAFPAVTFGAVVRPDSFDLYFAMDHAFGDGSSQLIGLAEILARYQDGISGWLGADGADEIGNHIDYTAAEYVRAAALAPDSPTVARWRESLSAGGGTIPSFPLPLGVDDEPLPVGFTREPLADAAQTEHLVELANSHGTSLIAVVYAALAATEAEIAGRDVYSTATVLSTRSGPHTLAQGWYCNFAPITFPIADGATVVDLIPQAAAALARAKSMAADPVHAALGALIGLGEIDPSVVASPQMVTFIDFRWFAEHRSLADAVLFTGEGRTRNASSWITRDHDGLRINTQHPDDPVAYASVNRYFSALRGIVGHTAASEVPACL